MDRKGETLKILSEDNNMVLLRQFLNTNINSSKTGQAVRGMAHNIYFFTPKTSLPTSVREGIKMAKIPSQNENEIVNICAALYYHLHLQGYEKGQIFVLALDQEQASSFYYVMLEKFGLEVEVTLVDQFKSCMNGAVAIIIASLILDKKCDRDNIKAEEEEEEEEAAGNICQMFSYISKENRDWSAINTGTGGLAGLYMIGDETALLELENTKEIIQLFQELQLMGTSLKLKCVTHGMVQQIRSLKNFPMTGGCSGVCSKGLPCGHPCTKKCHGLTRNRNCGPCQVIMVKTFPECVHRMALKCSSLHSRTDTDGNRNRSTIAMMKCLICPSVPELKASPCPHETNNNDGYKTGGSCEKYVTRKLLCGHLKLFRCKEPMEGAKCTKVVWVSRPLQCGHYIRAESRCFKRDQDKYKIKKAQHCEQDCLRKLRCGHPCELSCEGPNISDENHEAKHPCPKHHVSADPEIAQPQPHQHQTCHRKCSNGHICGTKHSSTTPTCPPCSEVLAIVRPGCQHKVQVQCHMFQETLGKTCEDPNCERLCKRHHKCKIPHSCSQKCPPCKKTIKCTFSACGHQMLVNCHDWDKSSSRRCPSKCTRPRPEGCAHFCPKPCMDHLEESCPPCTEIVTKIRDCGCEGTIPCGAEFSTTEICQNLVDIKDFSPCGHNILVKCHLKEYIINRGDANSHCKLPCGFYFNPEIGGCGHFCENECRSCAMNRFHQSCAKICGKPQICEHQCAENCSSTCSPCEQLCEASCDHGRCDHVCSSPCKPCNKPCRYSCLHGKCTKKCSEICNKEPCMEFCKKQTLRCGHPCIGYCGEPCPPLCSICDENDLLLQDFFGKTHIAPTDRFVLLVDCGHTIDSESLSCLMNIDTVDGEIAPKRCPILSCRKVIRNCNRFKSIILKIQEDIESVKKSIYGDPQEIQKAQEAALKYISGSITQDSCLCQFHGLKIRIMENLMEETYFGFTYGNYLQMSLTKAKFLAFVAELFQRSIIFLQKLKPDMPSELYSKIENSVRFFMDYIDSSWPLTPFELRSISFEWERIEILSKLYSQKGNQQTEVSRNLLDHRKGKVSFENAVRIATSLGVYDDNTQEKLHVAMKELEAALECRLNITDADRMSIVQSFGTAPGRWFKCENLHPYIVLECGGPTEVSTCVECGAKIGGIDHKVLASNDLASEMDGAAEPFFPRALSLV